MADSKELASAYVSVYPVTKDFAKKMNPALSSMATSASEKLGGAVKSGAGVLGVALGNIIANGVSNALGTISSSIGNAVSRYDTLNNFPKTMANLGISAQDASNAIDEISKGLTGLPTTLDAGASSVKRLTSVNGDIKKSTDYFLAMNNAIIAGGESTEIQSSAVEQLSQAYSKGKMDMMEWRTLQQAMPAQLQQIAKAMGKTTDALGEGLRNGSVSMDEFMDTIVTLNNEGVDGLASFSAQAKDAVGGIKTSFTNFKTTIVRGISKVIETIDTSLTKAGLPTIAEFIGKAAELVSSGFDNLILIISSIDFAGVIEAITPYWEVLCNVLGFVKDALIVVGTFLAENADIIAECLPWVIALWAAWKGYQKLSAAYTWLEGIGGSIGNISKKSSEAASKLPSVGTGIDKVGKKAGKSSKSIMTGAVSMLALGAAIALCAVGVWLMADAAVMVSSAGTGAILVFFGMIAAIVILVVVISSFGAALAAGAVGLIVFAVGLILVGVALLLVGFGAKLACEGMAILAPHIESISQYGFTAAGAIFLMGAALLVLGVGAIVAFVGVLLLGVGLIVLGVGAIVAGVGLLVLSVGLYACAGAIALIATSVTTIARDATIASDALTRMTDSINVVQTLMSALGANASGTMNIFVTAFDGSANKISSAAQNMINTLRNVMQSGMNAIMLSMTTTLQSAAAKMEASAYQIGAGVAKGLLKALPEVNKSAQLIVNECQRAINKKAEIASPAKAFYPAGEFMALGVAEGMERGAFAVERQGENVVSAAQRGMVLSPNANGGSSTTNIYVDGAKVNDNEGIETLFYSFMTELMKLSKMQGVKA